MSWEGMYLLYNRNVVKFFFSLSIILFGVTSHANYSHREFQSVTNEKEKKINNIRMQEVNQLIIILSRTKRPSERINLLLRLGKIYNELYKFYFFKENQIWVKKVKLSRNKRYQPKPDYNKSRQFLRKSIQQLTALLSHTKKHSNIKEVYYYLGFNYWKLNNKQKAIYYFEKIIKNYKRSPFAAEAYRYLGEYHFARRNFQTALNYYKQASRYSKSPVYSRSLYGLAWSQYKRRQYRNAMNSMRKAILIDQRHNQKEALARGIALQGDALDSLALFYSDGGKPANAENYFSSVVPEEKLYYPLGKLLKIYKRQGRYGSALVVSGYLEKLSPGDRENSESERYAILSSSLKLAIQKRNYPKEASVLDSLVKEFSSEETDGSIRESVRTTLRSRAVQAHKIGNKSKKSKRYYRHAINLYRLYLSAYSTEITKEDLHKIHIFLGEIYSKLKWYRRAAEEFSIIAKADNIDKKTKKEALTSLIFSLNKYVDKRKNRTNKNVDKLIKAINLYVSLYPDSPKTIEFLARSAGLLLKQKRMAEYKKKAYFIIKKYPNTPQAVEAATLLIKQAEEDRDWGQVKSLADLYLKTPKLLRYGAKNNLKKKLKDIQKRASFKKIESIEKKKNYAEAAKDYESLALTSKERSFQFKALNNAALNYGKANDEENELRIYKKINKAFPNNIDYAKKILSIYDRKFLTGKYEEACDDYESYFALGENSLKKKKKSIQKLSMGVIQKATLIRLALGQKKRAFSNIKKITKAAYKKINGARGIAEIFIYKKADIHRKEGQVKEAAKNYKQYISIFPNGKYSTMAHFHLGVIYDTFKEKKYARKNWNIIIKRSILNRSADIPYIAQAKLLLLAPLEKIYYGKSLRLPEKRLIRDVELKLKYLGQLKSKYLNVISNSDGKWAMEAFFRIAKIYKHFKEALLNSPTPKNYTEEEKAKFRAQLHSIVKPMDREIAQTLALASKKGASLKVISPIMAKIIIANAVQSPSKNNLPLIETISSWNTKEWILGSKGNVGKFRKILSKNPSNVPALIAVGNYHAIKEETMFAGIFYKQAIKINKSSIPAINNLAFLDARAGDLQNAFVGFQSILNRDILNITIKKNIGRLYKSSALWRRASAIYKKLETQAPDDDEVKLSLALSYLAMGKPHRAYSITDGNFGDGINGDFAEAIYDLAKGKTEDAKDELISLSSKNEYAKLILDFWKE